MGWVSLDQSAEAVNLDQICLGLSTECHGCRCADTHRMLQSKAVGSRPQKKGLDWGANCGRKIEIGGAFWANLGGSTGWAISVYHSIISMPVIMHSVLQIWMLVNGSEWVVWPSISYSPSVSRSAPTAPHDRCILFLADILRVGIFWRC